MPPALKRYWAARRRAKRGRLDPGRRRRRHRRAAPLYDFVRRRRRVRRLRLDPGRRRLGFRRRRLDPSIRGLSGFWSAILTPVATIIGSVFHNWLSVRKGIASGAIELPMTGKITHLGAIGWLVSTLFGYYGSGPTTDFLAHVGAGMASEGFNIPLIENVVRPEGPTGPGQRGTELSPMPYVPSEASWYR